MKPLPLSGIRVLEIGGYISAPYGTSLLRSLGADVVKVERVDQGDDFRRGLDSDSKYFRQYNAGKRSLAVDLKADAGVSLVKDLVRNADVVVENMRPGKLENLGLGHETCASLNPELVYTSVTGFGSGGPLAERPAYDTIGQAFGAFYSIMSDADDKRLTGTCVADLITGFSTATGVLIGLLSRQRHGSAPRVETSIMEAMSTLTVDALTQHYDDAGTSPTRTSRHPQAQNLVLRTASGPDIAVHLSSSQKFWIAFATAMGRPELVEDPRFATYRDRWDNYTSLADIADAEFVKHSADHWQQALESHDVPHAPVLGIDEFAEHPQTEWLGLVGDDHDGLRLLHAPWKLDGARPERPSHTPRVGEDSLAVAKEVRTDAEVDELIANGTIQAA